MHATLTYSPLNSPSEALPDRETVSVASPPFRHTPCRFWPRQVTTVWRNLRQHPRSDSSYTFSAKERDPETGLSYFGSRYYSSDLSIWLSVDPQAAKYPSLSPYTYCADNPIKLVDPDGEKIVIHGEDGDFTFTPDSECKSNDWKVKKAWENLNNIYGTEIGKTVINEMTKEGTPYFIFTDETLYSDGTGRFKEDDKGGGTTYMGGQLQTAGYMAHELFHGYQKLKGQGGLSIHNEVEANLFAMMTTNYNQALQPLNDFNFTTNYGSSFKAFIVGDVNSSNFDKHFGNLRDGFKSSAFDNYNHLYDNFPSGKNNNSLLKEFFK